MQTPRQLESYGQWQSNLASDVAGIKRQPQKGKSQLRSHPGTRQRCVVGVVQEGRAWWVVQEGRGVVGGAGGQGLVGGAVGAGAGGWCSRGGAWWVVQEGRAWWVVQ